MKRFAKYLLVLCLVPVVLAYLYVYYKANFQYEEQSQLSSFNYEQYTNSDLNLPLSEGGILGPEVNILNYAEAQINKDIERFALLNAKKTLRKVGPKRRIYWNDLTFAQRNQRLVNVGKSYVGNCTGRKSNCKIFTQRLVLIASGKEAYIPTTWPNAYGYQWHEGPYIERAASQKIEDALPGAFVQMNLNYIENGRRLPHTALVSRNSNGKVYFIENARRRPPDKNTYCIRESSRTHKWFNENTSGRFTIYYITNGQQV